MNRQDEERLSEPATVTYAYVVYAMCLDTEFNAMTVTARELVQLSKRSPQNFPRGLTEKQAQYMIDHWDEPIPEEDIVAN